MMCHKKRTPFLITKRKKNTIATPLKSLAIYPLQTRTTTKNNKKKKTRKKIQSAILKTCFDPL